MTEAQTRAHADIMAEKLKRFGWQYVVVDIQWYEPAAVGFQYRKDAPVILDEFGRLLPADNRFPSAKGGAGFKALADYVHSKGLKFGIHLMRGIPRQAVANNTPIKGASQRAKDIADTVNVCKGKGDMYGVDMSKPGAQEYYDSVFEQIAAWGVDLVKMDDLSAHAARPRGDMAPDWDIVQISAWDFRWDFSGWGSIAAEAALGPPRLDASSAMIVDFSTLANGAGRWRLDADTLEAVAQLPPAPAALPEPLMCPENAGMEVRTAVSRADGRRWALRLETLPRNRDLPREEIPPPSELRLYETADSEMGMAATMGS